MLRPRTEKDSNKDETIGEIILIILVAIIFFGVEFVTMTYKIFFDEENTSSKQKEKNHEKKNSYG